MTFSTLGLRPESIRAVADQGYTEPTPVQARAIPIILQGRDLLAGAQTGTGKTAAFVLPMLDGLHARRESGHRKVRALVVVPTRELALQVEQMVRTYGGRHPIRSVAIYGGVRMDRQVRSLRKWPEIVVATPGRLLDHVRQGTVNLKSVEILVLDEADRMLDMGFIHDIKRILEQLPKERQTLLFSATFSPKIRRLAEDLLRDPESVDVAPRNATPTPIRQVVHPVDKARKRHLLAHMVRGPEMGQVLVATDVAARGLDIDSLPHVVNYELPTVPEDYVHRIGRTGRAGQEGTAISLVSGEERELMSGIEKLLKKSIEHEVVKGFEPSAVYRAEPIVTTRPAHGRSRQRNAPRAEGGRPPVRRAGDGDGWVGHRAPKRHGPRPDADAQRRRQGRPGQAHQNQGQRHQGQPESVGRPAGPGRVQHGQGQAMPGERLSGRGPRKPGNRDHKMWQNAPSGGSRRDGGRPRP